MTILNFPNSAGAKFKPLPDNLLNIWTEEGGEDETGVAPTLAIFAALIAFWFAVGWALWKFWP